MLLLQPSCWEKANAQAEETVQVLAEICITIHQSGSKRLVTYSIAGSACAYLQTQDTPL